MKMEPPIVTIRQGQLRGCFLTDIDGGRIFSFLGIPYAKPPIGELRFKAPVAAEPWNGVRDATQEGDICYSKELMTGIIAGSEDCLNLNVFTKELPISSYKLKPVMVWIHGGAFVSGSNKTAMYGPEFLLTEDVVLVSINYRLGALGFLSLQDTSLGVPGNAGLKDQVLALKWIKENIKFFNGDPENVTIFGESAGSVCVHYHILSSSSKGLFHKAILQSGSALNHWALALYAVNDILKNLGQEAANEKEALEILQNCPVEKLFKAQEKVKATEKSSQKVYFAPVIEKPNETAFITRNVIDIIRSGDYNNVPMIIGYNTREGLLFAVNRVISEMSGKPIESKTVQQNIEDCIPWQVNLKRGSEASRIIYNKIFDVYFKGPDIPNNEYLLYTDSVFVVGIIASVINHLATSQNPIYLYRMSLVAGLNVLKNLGMLKNPGTCHADDLGYLFKNIMTPEIKPGSLEDISVRRFVKLWTNFAKYGNPTPDKNQLGVTWQPVKEGASNFLDIGEELTLGVNPETERMALWKEIFDHNPDSAQFFRISKI